MLTIRFSRTGKKKQPYYRLVVSEKARDPWGKATDMIGTYDPRTKKAVLDAERVKHWLSKGADVSDSVWNLFVREKLVDGKTRGVVPPAKAPAEAAPKAEEKKAEAPAA